MVITKTQAAGGGSLAVAGAGGAAAGTILTKDGSQNSEDIVEPIIPFTVLALDTDFVSDYSANGTNDGTKIGLKYGWYLIGTYGVPKDDGSQTDNETWWNTSYETWKQDSKDDLSDEFKDETKITSGFSSKESNDENSNKALNKVCKTSYEKTNFEVYLDGNGDDNQNKLGGNILRYCSPLGHMPKTISELNEYDKHKYTNSTYGSANGGDLISVHSSQNKKFWELKNQEFFGTNTKDGKGNGLDVAKNPSFHKLYSSKNNANKETIKDVCGRIYLLEKNTTNDEDEKIKKFCSWRYTS